MDTASDLLARLHELTDIGAELSSERELPRLLEHILLAAKRITRADGGTLYLIDEAGQHLRFAMVHTDTLGLALGGCTGRDIPFAPLPLRDGEGRPHDTMVAVRCAIEGRTISIPDAYEAQGYDFSGTRAFDRYTGYRSQSFLTVPMRDHNQDVIGVLQLINRLEPRTGRVTAFAETDRRLAESLASQAAIAITKVRLTGQLEELFESFIGLINIAIDEKSPHTGGHCQRVPALTMMLAEAVSASDSGPFADWKLTDKDRYELRIAALLHDCGKVTTPVHVVDKATKLQTLFDRIALVDTRFEVLKRDAEIEALRARLALREARDARAEAEIERDLAAELARIDAERDFIRHANIGVERMPEAERERVRVIGSGRRWRGPDGAEQPFLSEDEIENLAIRAGTLTRGEREVINHHIVATIRMLEALPWPRHLARVPEYAGGHHERMDGKGYPRGLTREQMSVPARIMGIADVFEALTAPDRPYKRAMKLSEALQVMARFARNGHIDPDLFEVFVGSKVYLAYARQSMDPALIDEAGEATVCGWRR